MLITTHLGQWYPLGMFFNIHVVRDNPNIYLYLNGELIFTSTPTTGFGSDNDTTYLGRSTTGVYDYEGAFAIASMYNRALTQPEVTQNYNAMKGRFL